MNKGKTNRSPKTCEICGTSCSVRVYDSRHGKNCDEDLIKRKNRGTIDGFSKYWINLKTGVLYKNTGKMMKANINARGNRVVNLTHDDGQRKKVNVDREWMKMMTYDLPDQGIRNLNQQLTAENMSLKGHISSDVTLILNTYFSDLNSETINRSVIMWTSFIMMIHPTLDRSFVRDVVITLLTGFVNTKGGSH